MSEFHSLSAFDFHHRMEEQTGISLVMFSASACSSCRAWKLLLQKLKQSRDDVQVFLVDAEKEMALVNEFEVFHLPAIFLYYNGQYHAPVESETSIDALQSKLEELLNQPRMEMP